MAQPLWKTVWWFLTKRNILLLYNPAVILLSISSVQSLSRVRLFATPWIAARQASLSIINSQSLPKPMSIESVMPFSHLILCCPLLLSFLYSSFVYSCHLFLISSASVRSLPFLSFIEPIFAWNVLLVSLIFLKRSLVFPILLFSSISLHWSLRKAFLSLLAILWNSHSDGISFLFSLLFTAICKASSDSHFAFLHFFSMGMVLIPVSCTMSRTYVHSSSGTLSIRSSPLNLFLTSTV